MSAELLGPVERLELERNEARRCGPWDENKVAQAGADAQLREDKAFFGPVLADQGKAITEALNRAESAERKLAEAREEREESQALLRRVYLILANVGNRLT